MESPLQTSGASTDAIPLRSLFLPFFVAMIVAFLWAFPSCWYSNPAIGSEYVWLGESTNVAGWHFNEVPISKLAESLLVSDHTVNGDYRSNDESRIVRIFSAKRYQGSRDQESLLRHTPDACWVGAGWTMQPLEPQFLDCRIHDLTIRFERRLFVFGGQRELVYFGAVIGGKPLTFRLDHYQNAGAQTSRENPGGLTKWMRQSRYWGMAWDAFKNRMGFDGPQQFIRLSTPVVGADIGLSDNLLQHFAPLWLTQANYQQELERWNLEREKSRGSKGASVKH